jgi:hypothetical protein
MTITCKLDHFIDVTNICNISRKDIALTLNLCQGSVFAAAINGTNQTNKAGSTCH